MGTVRRLGWEAGRSWNAHREDPGPRRSPRAPQATRGEHRKPSMGFSVFTTMWWPRWAARWTPQTRSCLTAGLGRARTGIVYLRTTRGAYPVLYPPGEPFAVGGSKVHRAGPNDRLALIGAGVTLHECLAAAAELAGSGIAARVIDLYSVKPLDAAALLDACEVTGSRLVIVEDHYRAGGIGGAVLEALADAGVPDLRVAHLAVDDLPGSGAPAELLDAARISARHIVTAARRLTGR